MNMKSDNKNMTNIEDLLSQVPDEKLLGIIAQANKTRKTTSIPTKTFQEEYKEVVKRCMTSKRYKSLNRYTKAEQMRHSR